MIGKDVASSILVAECTVHFPLQMQLRFEPKGQRRHPRAQALRCKRHIRLYQTVELGQWLVIEPHVIEVRRRNAAFAQAVFDRVDREAMVMLDAGEALLLRRRYDSAVDNERRRRIVVKCRDAEDACRTNWYRLFMVQPSDSRVPSINGPTQLPTRWSRAIATSLPTLEMLRDTLPAKDRQNALTSPTIKYNFRVIHPTVSHRDGPFVPQPIASPTP
jgi:hypothetical protein